MITLSAQDFDAAIGEVPDRPAVFLIHAREGQPYLGRTTVLRRRLTRLLAHREGTSRLLNLRSVFERVECWPTASRLDAALTFYTLARRYYPDNYLKLANLRMPSYLRVLLANEFPRTQIATRLGSRAYYYGPFRTRASAELFESQFLDLFQIRRCQEDLHPSPDHPGCIYGEMNRCLRPCQEVVGVTEYATEVNRVVEFLRTEGRSLVETISRARDRFSTELDFEEAAKQHRRLEKIDQVLKLRDDLVRNVDAYHGIAVTPSTSPHSVELRFLTKGLWQAPVNFSLEVIAGRPISLDARLREIASSQQPPAGTWVERQEHLALLSRWFYSSWCDGEWLFFDDPARIPYRKLVGMIHRIAAPVDKIRSVDQA
jgi:excinuclease ABC subunit C